MPAKTLADALITYADELNKGRQDRNGYLAAFPEYREELASLTNLAAKVKKTLAPVKPAPAFRESLRRDLLAAARQKIRPLFIIEDVYRPRGFIIVATIGSAVSLVVGLCVAFLMRSKVGHKSQEASSTCCESAA